MTERTNPSRAVAVLLYSTDTFSTWIVPNTAGRTILGDPLAWNTSPPVPGNSRANEALLTPTSTEPAVTLAKALSLTTSKSSPDFLKPKSPPISPNPPTVALNPVTENAITPEEIACSKV